MNAMLEDGFFTGTCPTCGQRDLQAENAKLRAAIDECLLLSDGGSGDLAIEMKRRLRIARG